jgi:hypothetical protein
METLFIFLVMMSLNSPNIKEIKHNIEIKRNVQLIIERWVLWFIFLKPVN